MHSFLIPLVLPSKPLRRILTDLQAKITPHVSINTKMNSLQICMNSPLPESWCSKDVSQIQPSIFGANFPNNTIILDQRQHEENLTFETS